MMCMRRSEDNTRTQDSLPQVIFWSPHIYYSSCTCVLGRLESYLSYYDTSCSTTGPGFSSYNSYGGSQRSASPVTGDLTPSSGTTHTIPANTHTSKTKELQPCAWEMAQWVSHWPHQPEELSSMPRMYLYPCCSHSQTDQNPKFTSHRPGV